MRLSKKILIVSYAMPPALTGSCFVIRNLTDRFSETDIIVAGEKWRSDRAYGDATIPSNFIYVWNQPNFKRTTLIKWYRRIWMPAILLRLWRLLKKQDCALVIGIYPNDTYLLLSYMLSKLSGKPFVSYFHNTYHENRSGWWTKAYSKWLQARVFKASKVVFTMSEGMRDLLSENYPHIRFEPLVHSHNIDKPPNTLNEHSQSPIRIGFLGNANQSNWDAIERFWGAVRNENVLLTIITSTSEAKFKERGIAGENVQFRRVPYREELDALGEQDILFLPHGFAGRMSDTEYKTIFPTKTISYLLSGQPILAHSPPESFLTEWLREHDCAEIVDSQDEQTIVDALHRLSTDTRRRKQLHDNSRQAAKMFHSDRVAGFFAQTIAEVAC